MMYYVMFNRNIVKESVREEDTSDAVFIVSGVGAVGDLVLDPGQDVLFFTDNIKGQVEQFDLRSGDRRVIYRGLNNPSSVTIANGKLTWVEGRGTSTKLVTGDTAGESDPTILSRYPNFSGKVESLIFHPGSQRYYFIRDDKVYRFRAGSRPVLMSEEPADALEVSEEGHVVISSGTKVSNRHVVIC